MKTQDTSLSFSERPDWVDDSLYPFKDRWIMIDGHRVHYLDEGPRNAPTFLFVYPGA